MRAILIVISACAAIGFTRAAVPGMVESDEGAKEYQQGYRLVLNEEWDQAQKIFRELIKKYPESAWVDDSRFWLCFILEKKGNGEEESFECYQDFVKQYRESKWANDAISNMIRLAKELEKQGKKEYIAMVETMQYEEQEEITMAAIQALQGRGDEKAFEALNKLYDNSQNDGIKKRILYVFGTMDSQKALAKVKEIAHREKNSSLRAEAVFWLSQQVESESVVQDLREIIENDPEYTVQKKGVFALAQLEYKSAHQEMMNLAKSHKNPSLRAEAVFWLSQSDGSDETLEFLKKLVTDDKNENVRKKAIFALSQFADEKGFPFLVELAQSAPDEAMRLDAVFWISQSSQTGKALDVLKDLALKDPAPAIQKKAIFSISQLPVEQSYPVLKSIVQDHESVNMRKEAVFWIGQIDGAPDRMDFLKQIAMKDVDAGVMEKALFAISQLEGDESIDVLVEIAQNHPLLRIRKKAIFWLGQSDNPRAREAIEKILFNQN